MVTSYQLPSYHAFDTVPNPSEKILSDADKFHYFNSCLKGDTSC